MSTIKLVVQAQRPWKSCNINQIKLFLVSATKTRDTTEYLSQTIIRLWRYQELDIGSISIYDPLSGMMDIAGVEGLTLEIVAEEIAKLFNEEVFDVVRQVKGE